MSEAAHRNKTHYEILGIRPEATGEEVRVAYRQMCRRFHPDRHPRHPEAAARIMASINVAYDVLSHPQRRADYDTELRGNGGTRAPRAPGPAPAWTHVPPGGWAAAPDPAPFFGSRHDTAAEAAHRRARALRRLMAASALCCVAGLALGAWIAVSPPPPAPEQDVARLLSARDRLAMSPGDVTKRAEQAGGEPVHIRPLESPNGLPWPGNSSELQGYVRRFNDGSARLVIDNRFGRSDVFAKVFRASVDGLEPACHVFVRNGDQLLLDQLRPGEYEVRYLTLDTGQTLRSQPVFLGERQADAPPTSLRVDQIQVRNGRATPITREEFETPVLELRASQEPGVRGPVAR
jgi:hypothetical protein